MNFSIGFTVGMSHTSLQTICACTGKHLIDSGYVPWMGSASEMEAFFTSLFDHILVGLNSGSFKSF